MAEGKPYWHWFCIVCSFYFLTVVHLSLGLDYDPNVVKCTVNPCENDGTCINMLVTKRAHGYKNPVMCSGDSCLEFVRTLANWHEANLACYNMSASLVALETGAEMDAVKSYIINHELYGSTDEKTTGFWTGGNDISREGLWVWAGSDRQITSWAPRSSSGRGNQRLQDCLELNTQYLEDYDFKWRASRCSDEKYFICEFPMQHLMQDRTYECLCLPGFHGYNCETKQTVAEPYRTRACDDDVMTLRCPTTSEETGDAELSQIHVLSAQYGRWHHDATICSAGAVGNSGSDCRFDGSRAKLAVSVFCEGRQECSFGVSRPTMGYTSDVCPGTTKYAEVVHECREPNALPTIECERDRGQEISCSSNSDNPYIFIEYANYGRMNDSICTSVQGTPANQCRSVTSLAVVSEWCNGKESCRLSADNIHFGDPCTGAYKYLEVRYRCTNQVPTQDWYPAPVGFPEIRSPVYCESTTRDGIVWQRTPVGQAAAAVCPDGKEGIVYWNCLVDEHQWDPTGPDYSRCISAWINRANEMIEDNIPAPEIAAGVEKNTDQDKSISSRDIIETVDVVENLVDLQASQLMGMNEDEKERSTKNFTEEIVSVGSNLLKDANIGEWSNIPEGQATSATLLTHSVESSALMLTEQLENEDIVTIEKSNIVLEALLWKPGAGNSEDVHFEFRGDGSDESPVGEGAITLPTSALRQNSNESVPARVVFIAYKNLGSLLNSEGKMADEDEPEASSKVVNSMVIAASINDMSYKVLGEEVVFILKHLLTDNMENATCAFWKYSQRRKQGQWSTDGCRRVTSNATHTECACSHLTNFAVLMDVQGTKLSESHNTALTVITYVGCIVSIICLVICVIVFSAFRSLFCVRNTIHRNLCLCLLIAETLFIVGIGRTENKIACSVMAGFMHYFFLASFSWMCLEGIQLYIMLVRVFAQEKSRIYLYYLAGYGIPAVIVGISAGIRHDGYGNEFHCWLKTETGLIWSFVGPVTAIAAVNLVFLCMALRVAYSHRSLPVKREEDPVTKAKVWVKGAVVLVCILGVTWIIGLMFVNEDSVVMAYVFTILNAFQGMFIFIFHCFMNERVQKEIGKRLRRSNRVPSFIRNKYQEHFLQSTTPDPRHSTSVSQPQAGRYLDVSNSGVSTISECMQISDSVTQRGSRNNTSDYTVT